MNPFIPIMIRASGRSWWEARYSDGRVLSEWDTGLNIFGPLNKTLLPTWSSGKTSRWEEVPKDHMIGLRLLCPNGMAGELEAPEGFKFFQLKHGGLDVLMGTGGEMGGPNRWQDAHIIGVVQNDQGECLCRAWQTQDVLIESGKTSSNSYQGTSTLTDLTKKWWRNSLLNPPGPGFRIGNTIWVNGQKQIIWGNTANTIKIKGKWDAAIPTGIPYEITGKKSELIRFTDNIYDMKYLHIGKLSLEVQGLRV